MKTPLHPPPAKRTPGPPAAAGPAPPFGNGDQAPAPAPAPGVRYDLTVVAPARNEAGNLAPLLAEVRAAFAGRSERVQVVFVDDGSTDATAAELKGLAAADPDLTVVTHPVGRGQSGALRSGFAAARSATVATLDADRQNDPADLPPMLDRLHTEHVDLVQGDRTAHRADHAGRRLASGVGRLARKHLLHDTVRDTGCATRVLRTELARRLPLDVDGMHRFIPACAAALGGRVVETPVSHRPRRAGRTKYGTDVLRRGLPGLRGCFYVRRLQRHGRDTSLSQPAAPPAP